ncbi:MAG TPA: hypothetical protein ENH40_06680 [Nitrospirae bacterium]|nr:hypothetical protein [Nitrospirota bacterium]
MRKLLFISLCLLVIFSFHNKAAAEITISGSSQFDSSLLEKYMKKHGYFYIGETDNEYALNVNTFAAKDAEIIIEDEQGAVLGTEMTDDEGRFDITVNREDVYKIIVKFHGLETVKIVKFPKIEDVMINVGYFDSNIIDRWLRTASLSY